MTSKTTSKVSSKHNRTPYERPTQEEIKKYQNAVTPATTQRNTEMWLCIIIITINTINKN